MDIEEFYDANELRRQSAEFEFGENWTDDLGRVHELSWVETTGELYLMGTPNEVVGVAPVDGELYPALAVTVLGTVASHGQVEATLVGWETAMDGPNSIAWLLAKFPTTES